MSKIELQKRLNPPKTHRAKRVLSEKAPKVIENVKKSLIIRGQKTSPTILSVLKDLHKLKDPYSKCLLRRNEIRPFDDISSLEFLCEKNDCSLFAFGNHNKKRTNNILFGRCYDYHILDMFEFGICEETFLSMDMCNNKESFQIGSKPCLLFQGEAFDNNPTLKNIKNFFIDYFHGEEIKRVNLLTLDHIIVFTAISEESLENQNVDMKLEHPIILFRHYNVELQASNNPKIPFVKINEIGPRMDLILRRHEQASQESQNNARIKFDLSKDPKRKNVALSSVFKQRVGKIHIQTNQQNLDRLKVKKMKGLRKALLKKGVLPPSRKPGKAGWSVGKARNKKAKNANNSQRRRAAATSEITNIDM